MYGPPPIVRGDPRDRLAKRLLVPVHARCRARRFQPSVQRLLRGLGMAIDAYVGEWALIVEDDWPAFVASRFPAYDLSKGGDQGPAGKADLVRAEYVDHKECTLLGWYYAGNGDRDIEAAAVAATIRAMKKERTRKDPRFSTKQAVLKAAGDEWEEEYPGEDE